ncbi:MAG: sialate O-acetylesterase [Armatimonadetes bacterium]|nr:sialate O-acetylesterase [Armatimonadota bacterium]MDW8122315.1 sialate O-acetylesterase [Armatimonadota bacterium]
MGTEVFWLGLMAILSSFANTRFEIPSLFSDHMVFQQGLPLRFWGRTTAGEKVEVRFADEVRETTADKEGRWEVTFPPRQAGGPFEVLLRSRGTEVRIQDVYVGEVWVASGQSNMEWPVSLSQDPEKEIPQARYPLIRFFNVPHVVAESPLESVSGEWKVCSPETVGNFSAVAYHFAREIHTRTGLPIGIIQSDWGGSPAEAWTSRPALEAHPVLRKILDRWQKALEEYPEAEKRYKEQLKKWQEEAEKAKAEGKPVPPPPFPPFGPGHFWTPSGLFNGMIAPLTRYPIRGVIWYQGESNVGRAAEYRVLFPALIRSWRDAWGLGDFPFLFVQLANFLKRKDEPSESDWAELREAQTFALQLPNTGMAVAIDIGDADDIHPKNKQDVGKRLALIARRLVFGEDVVASGPVFDRMVREGSKVRLFFRSVGSGLECRGDRLKGFAVRGRQGPFVWAEAVIEGDTVVVWSPQVPEPEVVRYAWADNPDANLYNKEGLPAVPFRSDAPRE